MARNLSHRPVGERLRLSLQINLLGHPRTRLCRGEARQPREAGEPEKVHPLVARRREVSGGGGEHHTAHALFVALGDELGDCTTHRVADGDERADTEHVGDRGHVVGAVFEAETFRRSQSATVAAVVGGEHAEVLAERLETGEPVQVGGRGPAVQQNERRGTARAGHFAHEGASAPDQFHLVTLRKAVASRMRAADHVRRTPRRRRSSLSACRWVPCTTRCRPPRARGARPRAAKWGSSLARRRRRVVLRGDR